jgi:hypothetical protein
MAMSEASRLGAFNKDKVANKFGIQLRPKETNKTSSRPSTPLFEKKSSTINASNRTAVSSTDIDSRRQTQINTSRTSRGNGTGVPSRVDPSTNNNDTLPPGKSSSGLNNATTSNERTRCSTSSVHHSAVSNRTQTQDTTEGHADSVNSPTSDLRSTGRRTSLNNVDQRLLLPGSSLLDPLNSTGASNTKTLAQIEQQKDQPLYRRQSSRTLDPTSCPATSKSNAQQHETTHCHAKR